jgi:hypothetical protein
VIDLRGLLQERGIELKAPNAMAAFDPASLRVTVAGTSEDQDMSESLLLNWGIVDPLYGWNLWTETNSESGGWGLACRSEEKAHIAKKIGESDGPSFEVEPTVESGQSVTLHYNFAVFSKGVPAGHLKSSTTLELGKPQEIAGHSADAREEKVVLTVSEN